MGNGPSENMGPAAFMWPPDRAWSGETDNTPPCGSASGVTNRTAFPVSGGKLAFTAQDDSYHAELSISFKSNPKSQSDFTPLFTAPITELDPGHTCLSLADQTSSQQFTAGTNATIQVKYIADFDRPENQTFYACADITFVPAASFNGADVPCFNATDPIDVPAPTQTGTPTGLPGHETEEHIVKKTVWTRVLTGGKRAVTSTNWKHHVTHPGQAVKRIIPHASKQGKDSSGFNLSYYRKSFFLLDKQTQFDLYIAGLAPKMTKREVDKLRSSVRQISRQYKTETVMYDAHISPSGYEAPLKDIVAEANAAKLRPGAGASD
ncbi:hypothetical protein NEMBOFW57_005531 [Staphylotrichum longicolle]|uniref:Copper acquisition factor BIM1-like domain-containing protein n=1 Tax=Staphylotrichum longicolle TaxID=669026 RepID=A0AAD4EWZ9_9PEZI|nr:hypothetical protein NEMBOFW57_005531 [Staphylotrichum longicolle]